LKTLLQGNNRERGADWREIPNWRTLVLHCAKSFWGKAQYKNTDISGTYRFTDVWAKRNGKWQHVAGQETLCSANK